MSKAKFGFSFILMLILVGMLSIVAFAATVSPVNAVKATVAKDHSITITWDNVPGATYNIYLDGTLETTTALTSPTYSFSPEEDGKLEIEVITTDGTAKSEFSWNAILDATKAANDGDFDNAIVNSNHTGVGVGGQDANFNQVIKSDNMVTTGPDGKRSTTQTTHRTHGDYQNNTNSCASCHQTHTGASKSLLFKDGVYTTCTACHDGTLGFYNVLAPGDIARTASEASGTFGGTHDGNMSIHLANGAVSIKAAPGGNRSGKDADGNDVAGWSSEFTCASCHAPHGSYSDRLLNFNPNDMGNTLPKNGGKKLAGVKFVTDITSKYTGYTAAEETALGGNYVIYKFTASDADILKTDYAAKKVPKNAIVYQLMKWNPDYLDVDGNPAPRYEEEKDPWLHGYDWADGHAYKIYWSSFQGTMTGKTYKSDNTLKFSGDIEYSIVNTDSIKDGVVIQGNGFFAVPDPTKLSVTTDTKGTTSKSDDTKVSGTALLDEIDYANIARAYVVQLDKTPDTTLSTQLGYTVYKTNVKSLWAGGAFKNYGVNVSKFCSACHTDYLATSEKQTAANGGEGTFSHAYRHTTTSDSYTCVRCHYAHGTDVTIMKDSMSKNLQDIMDDATYFPDYPKGDQAQNDLRIQKIKDYLLDKNPSSALKRYTNMAVCWGCHTSSHSEGFRNGSTFDNQSGQGGSYDKVGLQNSW